MRVRDADRQTRRSLHRLSGIQRAAGGRRCRGLGRYTACTHATNHSWDQGADGIARLWDTLASKGIAQTGSYKTEEDSTKPLVIDSPTGGGKLGLVTGTVSLNGMTADHDWQVDRLREAGDPQHQSDIDRAVAKAKAAREQRRRGGHGHAFGAGIHRLRRFVAGLRGA